MGVYGVARLGSIHNTYHVPLEPERAAKARRAVVASLSFLNLKLLLVDDYALELRT